MFYKIYLKSDFHTNTVISRRVFQLVKMASKTVIRPIGKLAVSLHRNPFADVIFEIISAEKSRTASLR